MKQSVVNVETGAMPETATYRRISSAPAPWTGGRRRPSPAIYDVTIERNIRIEMSDGVALYADIHYPANSITGQLASGTFPVILALNPYGAKFQLHDEAYLVKRGYICVTVDVRGTKRSEGAYDFLGPRDRQDGVELVNWCAYQLHGSDGVVGMAGPSYLGFNQLLTASMIGPGSPLKAIFPSYAGANIYREAIAKGGMPTRLSAIVAGWMEDSGPSAAAFWQRLVANVRIGANLAYDNDYWRSREPIKMAPAVVQSGAAVLLWTGHNDLLTAGAQKLYAALQNASAGRDVYAPMRPDQKTTARYQIVVGPYAHTDGVLTQPFLAIQLDWFDTWLKDVDTGLADVRTTYHGYELGSDRWVNASVYPLVSTYTTYYLNKNGSLTSQPPSVPDESDLIASTPRDSGCHDTLEYVTEPFAEGATIGGPGSVTLYAIATAPEAEFVAELSIVAPDGTGSLITRGELIGSQRETDTNRNWYDSDERLIAPYHPFTIESEHLVPLGEVERYDLELWPRLVSVAPGERLSLKITSGAPASGFMPGSPTPVQLARLRGVTCRIQRNCRSSSAVNLPLLPYRYFSAAASQAGPLDWVSFNDDQPEGDRRQDKQNRQK